MEADREPEVAAAEVGVAEKDAETGGVGAAQPVGVGVGSVQESEDDAETLSIFGCG